MFYRIHHSGDRQQLCALAVFDISNGIFDRVGQDHDACHDQLCHAIDRRHAVCQGRGQDRLQAVHNRRARLLRVGSHRACALPGRRRSLCRALDRGRALCGRRRIDRGACQPDRRGVPDDGQDGRDELASLLLLLGQCGGHLGDNAFAVGDRFGALALAGGRLGGGADLQRDLLRLCAGRQHFGCLR